MKNKQLQMSRDTSLTKNECIILIKEERRTFFNSLPPTISFWKCRTFWIKNLPFQWAQCKQPSPSQSQWTPIQCLPSCTPPVPARTCGGWRTVAVSHWWSWCTAAPGCWTMQKEDLLVKMKNYSVELTPVHPVKVFFHSLNISFCLIFFVLFCSCYF